ncbi:hypothetical protein Tco_1319999 [Tanacetum coccineum]
MSSSNSNSIKKTFNPNKPTFRHETDENESDSKSNHQENEEEDEDDEEEVKDKFVKTPSNNSDDEDETKSTKTEVPVTSSSHSSDLAAKSLNFSDIPHTDAEIVSPMDVHVHHEVPDQQTPTLLTVPVSVITDSSPVFSTVIPQTLPSFTPLPQQSISTTNP